MGNKYIHAIHLVTNLDNSFGGPAKSVPHLCGSLQSLGVKVQLLSVKKAMNEENEVVAQYSLP